MGDVICERCGKVLQISDFPFCKGDAADHTPGSFGIVPDNIPGGVLVEHGLCNPDGTARRFDSKSEMAAAAKAAGLIPFVRHQGDERGSDKSRNTQRWV